MKKITTLFLASIIITTGLFAQKQPVVATVDINRVTSDYKAMQTAIEKVKGSIAPVNEEIQGMEASINATVAQMRELDTKAKNPAASEEAKQQAITELEGLRQQAMKAQEQLQQFRAQAQQLSQKGQQDEINPLLEKAAEAVKTVAVDKGIDLVVAKRVIIYGNDDLEITDAVIAVLNAGK
jgi:Skp family chaperone for outer membrane proteins